MQTNFRLVIAMPATGVANNFTKTYTQEDQAVQSIEVELKKEKSRLSYLTANIRDPGLRVFGQLPEPAFFDVPVTLYMVEPAKTSTPTLVFDGKMTKLAAKWPSQDVEIVAHDKSIDMRRRARARTFKNMTSVQIVQKIAAEYGLSVDASSLGDSKLVARTISHGLAPGGVAYLSDWEHCVRELESDGLRMHVRGSKIYVEQLPTSLFATTFRPGDGRVISLDVSINHVRGPGDMGNTKGNVALDHSGTEQAVSGAAASEAQKAKDGDGKTHSHPVGGPSSKHKGAHTEDTTGARWTNQVTPRRGRKDEATLMLNPTPSLYLTNLVPLAGFGAKIDGNWEVLSIKHAVVPGSGGSNTSVSLERGTSKGGAKQAGTVAFAYSGA